MSTVLLAYSHTFALRDIPDTHNSASGLWHWLLGRRRGKRKLCTYLLTQFTVL
jgi:hypothetical protein